MKTITKAQRLALLTGFCILQPSSFILAQGPLTPPGAPLPTMKTLDQIDAKLEPRTPISALPFTIGTGGSYYLTGNLTAAASAAGIVVNASHVTLDLGGFVLTGSGVGTLQTGVRVNAGFTNVTIRNGTVRAWNADGISIANTATCTELRVENVRAISNAGAGIAIGDEGTASGCAVRGNGNTGISGGRSCQVLACTATHQTGFGAGIDLGDRAVVRECVATDNAADGINVGIDSIIAHCATKQNGDDGIVAGTGAVLQACTAATNSNRGILTGSGSSVSECTVQANNGASGIAVGLGSAVLRCVARANSSSAAASQGILAGTSSSVIECNVYNTISTAAASTASTGMGITVGNDCLVERNTVTSSEGDGIRAGGFCRIIGNLCNGSGSAPTIDGAGIHVTGTGAHLDGNSITGAKRGIEVANNGSTIVRNRVRLCTANYVIAAGNNLGAIIVPGNNAAINGNAAVASSLGTTDPWANLSH